MHALYNSRYSQSGSTAGTLVVLHLNGSKCQVSLINPETGVVFDQTSTLDLVQTDYNDLSTILVPLSDSSGSISNKSAFNSFEIILAISLVVAVAEKYVTKIFIFLSPLINL